MPLPTSRDETCAPLGQVKSSLLNNIQDCVIGGKHGVRVRNFSPIIGDGTSCVGVSQPARLEMNAATEAIFPLTFDEGDRISALTFARIGNGTVDLTTVELYVGTPNAESVVADIPGGVNNLGAGAYVDSSLTFSGPVTIGAGEVATLRIVSNATGAKIGAIRATYDRP